MRRRNQPEGSLFRATFCARKFDHLDTEKEPQDPCTDDDEFVVARRIGGHLERRAAAQNMRDFGANNLSRCTVCVLVSNRCTCHACVASTNFRGVWSLAGLDRGTLGETQSPRCVVASFFQLYRASSWPDCFYRRCNVGHRIGHPTRFITTRLATNVGPCSGHR